MSLIILKIAVPVPVNQLFDFLPNPSDPLEKYQPGCRVVVPFAARRCVGIIADIRQHSDLPVSKIKAVSHLLDSSPLLNEEIINLAQWSANYYHYPIGEVFHQILPVLYRKPDYMSEMDKICWRISESGAKVPIEQFSRAKLQQKMLTILRQQPDGLTADQIRALFKPGWQNILKRLEQLDYVEKVKLSEIAPAGRLKHNDNHTNYHRQLTLNDEQSVILKQLTANNDYFYPCLLDGVTGSGKTEVYLQFISLLLEKKLQVLVLVPEINLTPQLFSRFQQRFNCNMVILHSSISKKQRLVNWLKAGSGEADIIIGTRSAIFTPMKHPGAIILDEEHDMSFKQQDGFRYNARDLAVFRARYLDIPVILGSATPSLESLANARENKYHYLTLKKRAANSHNNKFTLLDVRNKLIEQGISHELKTVIQDELEKNNQILLFQNRRGYSPTLFCHNCGWVARCPSCDANLTLHSNDNYLLCHHCENKTPIPKNCLSCDSPQLDIMGAGTQRIEETMQQLFPDIEIFRIDRDSTRLKGSFEKLIDKINSGEKQILVGTQMLSKGHHFPNVTLVVILDIDQGLFSSDFRALEKMAQSIVQVAGRAGRAEKPGHVVLQTHQPEHPFFATLLNEGYSAFASNSLLERKQMALPPYQYMALLRSEAKDKQLNLGFLHLCLQLGQSIQKQQDTSQNIMQYIQLQGPIPSPMERRGGLYRAQILVQSANRTILQQFLQQWLATIPKQKNIKWNIDIDPLEMS